jgi:hypothetical protein
VSFSASSLQGPLEKKTVPTIGPSRFHVDDRNQREIQPQGSKDGNPFLKMD